MILFVTSFDRTLYEASGRTLVDSFLEHQKIGRLLCCHESSPPEKDDVALIKFDISKDPFLIEWDRKYRARCEKAADYWRRRAWQWYRKCVSLRLALRYLEPAWLVWLDCDCEFRGCIDNRFFERVAGPGRGIFYMLGEREWTETSIIVFHCENKSTLRFLESFFHWYESGRFVELPRWDDCWIFDTVRKEFVQPLFYDMVRPLQPGEKPSLHVAGRSELADCLIHKKGSHLRSGVRK